MRKSQTDYCKVEYPKGIQPFWLYSYLCNVKYLAFILFFTFHTAVAQNRNSVWCFGDSAGIDFSNTNSPMPITTALDTRGSCVSISDSVGHLLFYANTRATIAGNTTLVWNSTNQLMQNGSNIVGSGWYRELVIVPNPSNNNQYYLFSVGVTSSFGLYYSVIDLNQNGGLGAVTQKNIQVLSSEMSDGIQAVKHGNGRDWWVFCKRTDMSNNEIIKVLITPSGVSAPSTQSIGDSTYINTTQIDFTADGKNMFITSGGGMCEIFDFDRCTGMVSNLRTILHEYTAIPIWSGAISFTKSCMYLSIGNATSYLLQLNLLDTMPWATHDTLWIQDSLTYAGGWLKLAPDKKIYYSCDVYDGVNFPYPYPDSAHFLENENLGVINSPDSFGGLCDFQSYNFYLGGSRCYLGLPNNPDYELRSDSGSMCDTLLNVTVAQIEVDKSELNIFYHPSWHTLFVNADNLKGKTYSLAIYDVAGREMFNEIGVLTTSYFTQDILFNTQSSAIFILLLETEKEKLVKKIFIGAEN